MSFTPRATCRKRFFLMITPAISMCSKNKQCAMMAGSNQTIEEMEEKLPTANMDYSPVPMFDGESEYITVGQLDCVFFIPKRCRPCGGGKGLLELPGPAGAVRQSPGDGCVSPSIKGAKSPELTPSRKKWRNITMTDGLPLK